MKQEVKTGHRVQWVCPAGTGVYGERRQRGTVKAITAKTIRVEWDIGLVASYARGCGNVRRVRKIRRR